MLAELLAEILKAGAAVSLVQNGSEFYAMVGLRQGRAVTRTVHGQELLETLRGAWRDCQAGDSLAVDESADSASSAPR